MVWCIPVHRKEFQFLFIYKVQIEVKFFLFCLGIKRITLGSEINWIPLFQIKWKSILRYVYDFFQKQNTWYTSGRGWFHGNVLPRLGPPSFSHPHTAHPPYFPKFPTGKLIYYLQNIAYLISSHFLILSFSRHLNMWYWRVNCICVSEADLLKMWHQFVQRTTKILLVIVLII